MLNASFCLINCVQNRQLNQPFGSFAGVDETACSNEINIKDNVFFVTEKTLLSCVLIKWCKKISHGQKSAMN